VGTAHPAAGGFKAAQNDYYISAGVFDEPGNSFLFADLAQNQFQCTATVITLTTASQPSDIPTGIALVPEPSTALLAVGAPVLLAIRCPRTSHERRET
jgi:hypothetical protein